MIDNFLKAWGSMCEWGPAPEPPYQEVKTVEHTVDKGAVEVVLSSTGYQATSDGEDHWPTFVMVTAACGCALDYKVRGNFLDTGELIPCGSGECDFEWGPAYAAGYKHLDDLRSLAR